MPGPTDPSIDETASAERTVREFIESRINFERLSTERYDLRDFKLSRMRSLLERLGSPQRLPAVHIAGTKGKGSTAAMTASILTAAGHRTGLFTSPHIEHFSERMTVDGLRPTAAELLRLVDDLLPVIADMDALGPEMRPTFFEVLTAMAWRHFQRSGVDIVVLETGLGGRLDATNVCDPRVCVITNISRDHERLLGSTLAAIAGEKAGIIKAGVPVISGVSNVESRNVIRRVADETGATLLELDREITRTKSAASAVSSADRRVPRHQRVTVTTPWRTHENVPVPLAGAHQAGNLSLALAAIDLLDAGGVTVTRDSVNAGLSRLEWPLRVDVLGHAPLIIVDAAHNGASVEALVETLADVTAKRRILIFATSKDKDTAGLLSRLGTAFDEVILTRFVNNPRAVSIKQLEQMAGDVLSIPTTSAPTPADALRLARFHAQPNDLICGTGSFFLAAELRTLLRDSAH